MTLISCNMYVMGSNVFCVVWLFCVNAEMEQKQRNKRVSLKPPTYFNNGLSDKRLFLIMLLDTSFHWETIKKHSKNHKHTQTATQVGVQTSYLVGLLIITHYLSRKNNKDINQNIYTPIMVK